VQRVSSPTRFVLVPFSRKVTNQDDLYPSMRSVSINRRLATPASASTTLGSKSVAYVLVNDVVVAL
jgi:hypothetical protein